MKIDGEEYFVKPMNCPFHIQIYKSRIRSYRELPIRFAEWGTVYRYERSGVLHGLLRVRGFTQDDAHHLLPPGSDARGDRLYVEFLPAHPAPFGLNEFHAYLSTRNPEKSAGEVKDWDGCHRSLREGFGTCRIGLRS